MSLPKTICDTAKDIIFKMAVNSGDHFRSWVYPRLPKNYDFNPTLEREIEQGMLRGLSAEDISREIYDRHA